MTLDAPTIRMATMHHRKCNWSGVPIVRIVGPHLGAYCQTCYSHIGWVPKDDLWQTIYDSQRKPGIDIEPARLRHCFVYVANQCREIAESKGWHTSPRSTLERAMLVVTECAELSEAARHGTLDHASDHIPEHSQAAEEWADMLIRVFDHSVDDGVTSGQLIDALFAKMDYNRSRPHRHGGKTI